MPTRCLIALSLLLATAQTFAATVTVNISNFQFNPQTVTINVGDTVKWSNSDPATHTTLSDTGAWSSGNLIQGQSFSHTFSSAGKFTYKCAIHPSFMSGTVVVTAPPEQSRIQAGKNLVKTMLPGVKLNLTGKSADSVYLGSYLVNAASGCANCHSCPTFAAGHNPYKGEPRQFNVATYLAGGVLVSGGGTDGTAATEVSANLTPNAAGKPAKGMTLAKFKDTLRNGHDPDVAGELLPVMPWPFFGQMTDHDLAAIYDYLSAIPALNTPKPPFCASPGL
jgi:plastocyanin